MIVKEDLKFMSNHNHTEISNFRNPDCIIKIPQLIDRAVELGYDGISITDHEAVTGHVKFLQHYLDLKNSKKLPENFKVCLGNEIYLLSEQEYYDAKNNYESGVTKYWHFILLAKDREGYQQLKEISSESAWTNYFRQMNQERVPTIKEELEQIIGNNKGHLICSTACIGSEFAKLVLDYFRDNKEGSKRKLHNFISWMIEVFGKENVFLEMQPCKDIYLDEEKTQLHPQIIVNQSIVKLAKAYGLSYQVTTDAHYLKEQDIKIHEAYLNSDEDGKAHRETSEFYKTCYLWDKDLLYENLLEHLDEEAVLKAFEGTQRIHEMITDYNLSHEVIVPEDFHVSDNIELQHIFADYYDIYDYLCLFGRSTHKQDKEFLRMIENGFIRKNQEFNETNIARINRELEIIWKISESLNQKLSSYYVLVRNIIHEIMWKVSYVGVSRGSVTGFYVAYLTDIMQVNPLKHNLPEWRHLHEQRPELPDIDVDSESSKRSMIFAGMKEYFGENNVLNTLTLKTEGSKSALLTSARGMGIDNDLAQAMADMIPFERGANWSFKDCFEGNEEKGRKPVKELINEVAKYDGLKDVMFMLEGLISGRSIHASAVYIFSNGYLEQNSKMRAPNGTWITSYNMLDSDFCGALKFDCLTIRNLDILHKTVDLLIENKFIEDKGTIKANYDTYIHPDVLEYEDPKMWEMLGNNELINAFQFDTVQGIQAVKKVKPKSLKELSIANSLMRLMADGEDDQPIDVYVNQKNDISLWYDELHKHNLNEEEIKILEKHLLLDYGVSAEQESVMELTMDPKISGFSVKEANGLRKAIAKKKAKLLEETKELFFNKGQLAGTRNELLDYVWNVQFKRQFGYSFSKNHTLPYSVICLQEMNLATKYPQIFWNTACLSINAGADEDNENNKTTNYGKVAKAISEIQKRGQIVALPHINKAKFGFSPDLETDEIIFSLKGIQNVGDDLAKKIIENQPYESLIDFIEKMNKVKEDEKEFKCGNTSIISLIKAGCFDLLENKDRSEIMKEFIKTISKPLKSLGMDNIEELKMLGQLTPQQLGYEYRLHKFRKYVLDKQFFVEQEGKSINTGWYHIEEKFALPYFYTHFEGNMEEEKDYKYLDDGRLCVKRGSLDREFKKLITNFKETVIDSSEMLDIVNKYRFDLTWEDNAFGTISKWEMDSLSFYYHEHELAHVDRNYYTISDYDNLSASPEVAEYYMWRGKEKPRFKLTRICGTVLDKDKNKHIVTLLTPSGVVLVKFYKGQFGFYDQQLSEIDEETDKKTVIEKSWFARGTKLLITGFRREDQFVPKNYSDSIYKHSVQLIRQIEDDGKLILQNERAGKESEEI